MMMDDVALYLHQRRYKCRAIIPSLDNCINVDVVVEQRKDCSTSHICKATFISYCHSSHLRQSLAAFSGATVGRHLLQC